ncbi:methyl-accepting chemotaxis protein [Halomicrobium sp. IBSBa]|uniref:HAMP domain-containing protein n=1 Tax=Halomicrobium sp. IBSBa TaxID=2778916 RepID=UPI001ABFFFFD|nr:methyl-accepting chemotaxis protein [Halomicrobium sp. IBSBa]MBO4247958.1 methyl-accepting chemotaxis protein [Halomicrobium sp. IBSBa]
MDSQGDSGSDGWSVLPSAIRRRFVWKFLTTVAVVIVVTAGIGIVSLNTATATLTGQVDERTTTTAELQADALDRWLDGHRDTANQIGLRPDVQAGNASSVQSYFDAHRFGPDVVSVNYVADDGTVLASTNASRVDTTVTGTAVGEAITAGVPVGPAQVVDDTYARRGTTVAGIVGNSVGSEGVILVEASLGEPVAGFDPKDRSGYTTLHDSEGMLFATVESPANVPERVRRASDTGSVNLESSASEVVGHAPVAGTDWVIVRHLPASAAFAVREEIRTGILAVMGAPLVLLGGLVLVSGRRTGNALERLERKAGRIEDGDLDVTLEQTRADEIGRLTAAFDSMRQSLREEIEEARSARKAAEVSRAEAMELTGYLEATADDYSDVLAECAAGDLTVRMEPDGEHDAMDRIARDFNDTVAELEKTTGQLKTFAEDVADSADHVETSTATLRQASEQVAEAAQQVSLDAYEQQEQLAEISEEVDAVARTLERHADQHEALDLDEPLARIRAVATTLSDVAEISEETTQAAETVAGAAEEQTAELNEVSQQASTLKQYAGPLGDVLSRFRTESEREFFFPSGPGNVGEETANDSGPGE